MDEQSILYLSKYINVTDDIKMRIETHARRYRIEPKICAWYKNWEDFCSDWCIGQGYTRTQARKLLHGGIGEFMELSDGLGIVRFTLQKVYQSV